VALPEPLERARIAHRGRDQQLAQRRSIERARQTRICESSLAPYKVTIGEFEVNYSLDSKGQRDGFLRRFGNAEIERLWGYPALPAAQAIDYGIYQSFRADGQPYLPEEWPLERALTSGEVVNNEEIHVQRDDGSSGIVSVNAAPIYDERNQIVTAVATFMDITLRKRAEAERAELFVREQVALAEAQEALRVRDAFLSIASHEIKTP
jgi:PAS domain-containing protein